MKFRDIPPIPQKTTPDEARNITNELIEGWNSLHSSILLGDNFNGQIIENIVIANGEEKQIAHNLGIVPPYRIILRQEGNGVVTDIPSGWTKNSIKLINNGPDEVILTVMIVRG